MAAQAVHVWRVRSGVLALQSALDGSISTLVLLKLVLRLKEPSAAKQGRE